MSNQVWIVQVNTYIMTPTIDDVNYNDHSQVDFFLNKLNLKTKADVNKEDDNLIIYLDKYNDAVELMRLINSQNNKLPASIQCRDR